MDSTLKILVVGETGVGKTTALRRLAMRPNAAKVVPTVAVEFYAASLDLAGKETRLQFWDTCTERCYEGVAMSYLQQVDAVLVVYDLTSFSSLHRASEWISNIYQQKAIPFLLFGNKLDLCANAETREVNGEELEVIKGVDAITMQGSGMIDSSLQKGLRKLLQSSSPLNKNFSQETQFSSKKSLTRLAAAEEPLPRQIPRLILNICLPLITLKTQYDVLHSAVIIAKYQKSEPWRQSSPVNNQKSGLQKQEIESFPYSTYKMEAKQPSLQQLILHRFICLDWGSLTMKRFVVRSDCRREHIHLDAQPQYSRISSLRQAVRMLDKDEGSFQLLQRHQLQAEECSKSSESGLVIILYYMGTIESKLKDGYSIKQKPFFKAKSQKGAPPTLQTQIQNNLWPTTPQRKKSLVSNTGSDLRIVQLYEGDWEQREGIKVKQVSQYPFCGVGLISFQIGQQVKYGTGCLIGSNIVLTCAHNLFSLKHGEEARNIKFIPAYSSTKQNEHYSAKNIYYPAQFKGNTFNDEEYHSKLFLHDYAIIRLDTKVDLQAEFGRLGFSFNQDDHTTDTDKLILGFTHRSKHPVALYQLMGRVKFQNHLINYRLHTEIGMSGGPIIDKVDGEYYVIGIHTYMRNGSKSVERGGLRLNEAMYNQINEWITQEQEEIDLRDKNIGKEGIKQLSKLKWNSLHVINLARNNIGKDGLKHISKCQWNNLYQLDLGGNNIGKEGVEYLTKACMKKLVSLNLWGNTIGKEGVELILNSQWDHLSNLNLYNNQICNEGLQILIKMRWPELNNLNLGKNNLDNGGVTILLRSSWPSIVSLNLWGNKIKQQKMTYAELKKHFLKVKFLYL